MRRIALRARDGSVRAYALVDDEDFERFGHLRWCLHGEGYAHRRDGRGYVLLHRAVMGLVRGDGREVDHKNRDRLDCQRTNLRVLPRGGNQQNASPSGRSRFRGVQWHARKGRWQARVRQQFLGYFEVELDAAIAAERARLELMPFAEADPRLAGLLA